MFSKGDSYSQPSDRPSTSGSRKPGNPDILQERRAEADRLTYLRKNNPASILAGHPVQPEANISFHPQVPLEHQQSLQLSEASVHMQHRQEPGTPMVNWVRDEINNYVNAGWNHNNAFRHIYDTLSPEQQDTYRREQAWQERYSQHANSYGPQQLQQPWQPQPFPTRPEASTFPHQQANPYDLQQPQQPQHPYPHDQPQSAYTPQQGDYRHPAQSDYNSPSKAQDTTTNNPSQDKNTEQSTHVLTPQDYRSYRRDDKPIPPAATSEVFRKRFHEGIMRKDFTFIMDTIVRNLQKTSSTRDNNRLYSGSEEVSLETKWQTDASHLTTTPTGIESNKEIIQHNRDNLLVKLQCINNFLFTNKPTRYKDVMEAVQWIANLNIEDDIRSRNKDLKKFVTLCNNLHKEFHEHEANEEEESSYLNAARTLKENFSSATMANKDILKLGTLCHITDDLQRRYEKKGKIGQNRKDFATRLHHIHNFAIADESTGYKDVMEAVQWIANLNIEDDIKSRNKDLKKFVTHCKQILRSRKQVF